MWAFILALSVLAQTPAEKPTFSIETLLENKIAAVHEHRVAKHRGLRALREARTVEGLRQALKTLMDIPTLIRESELLPVWNALPKEVFEDPFVQIDLIQWISRHGDRAARQNLLPKLRVPRSLGSAAGYQSAGPWLVLPKDEPNFRGLTSPPSGQSDWTKPEWLYDRRGWVRSEFSFYSHAIIPPGTIGGVVYRNIEFRPGDLILLSHALPEDGFITSVMAPRQYASHMALYLELEVMNGPNRENIPVVFEIFDGGLRLVPLHQYVGENFSRIAEVWRLRPEHTPKNFKKNITQAVLNALATPMGYDFLSTDFTDAEVQMPVLPESRRFATCATISDYVLRKAGVDLSTLPRDKVSPGWEANLAAWKNVMAQLLTPQSFIESGLFDLIGTVDNDDLEGLILAELIYGSPKVPGTVTHLIATQDFNLNALDYPFLLGMASILPTSWDEFLGGLPPGTFPRASMEVLRLLWMANAANTDSFRSMERDADFVNMMDLLKIADHFSILEFERSPMAVALRERWMARQRSWFNPRNGTGLR